MEKQRRFLPNILYVFYDGWCPLCIKSSKRIEKLNWLNLVHFISLRDQEMIRHFRMEESNLEKRIQSRIYGELKTYEGIYTLLQISFRIPLLWIIIPFIYLIILFGLGQKSYDWIASRRLIIPIGQCSEVHCEIRKSP